MNTVAGRRIVVVTLAVAAALLAAWSMSQGPGISPDSTFYASAARGMRSGDGLITPSGDPLTIFPPGLPLLLSITAVTSDVEVAAIVLNSMCMVAVVLLVYIGASRHVGESWIAVGAAAFAATALGLLEIMGMLWSEPPFVVSAAVAVLALEKIFRDRGDWSWGYPTAIAAIWVSYLLRYAGITLVATGALVVALSFSNRGLGRALVRGLAFGAAASLAAVVVSLRNLWLGTGPLGDRVAGDRTVPGVLEDSIVAVGRWVLPSGWPEPVHALSAAVIVGFLGLGFVLRARRTGVDGLWSLMPLTAFIVIYALYLFASQLLTRIDPVNVRLTSPVFPPLVILGAVAAHELLMTLRTTGLQRRALLLLASGFVALLLVEAQGTVLAGHHRAVSGVGYNNREWQSSDLLNAVAALPHDAALASNMPDAIYWLADRNGVRWSPNRSLEDLDAFREWVSAAGTVRLLWFDRSTRAYLLTPPELRTLGLDMTILEEFADGVLYEAWTSTGDSDAVLQG